jgi:hypothetical protein
MTKHLHWRAVEANAHRMARENPDAFFRVWIENLETEYSTDVTLRSSTRGFLSDQSIAALRAAKEVVDGGEDFDGARVYEITFLEPDPKATRVAVARSRRMV